MMPEHADNTRIKFLSRPSGERLLRTAFWTLWCITVGSLTYTLAAEILGLSIFDPGYQCKYYMTKECPVLEAITSTATVMLAVVTAAVWRLAPRLRKFGIAACILELYYIGIPRF